MRFHGTAASRAYSAKVRSHFPESGRGRAASAGAGQLSARTSSAAAKRLALVEDRPGDVGVGGAEADRVLALLVLLERHGGVADAGEDRRAAVFRLVAVVAAVEQV